MALLCRRVAYGELVLPFLCCGLGMANVVLGSVPGTDEGVASGANNAIREPGGVLGVAVLTTVFASQGSYASASSFVAGLQPATAIGAAVVAVGAAAAMLIPRRRRQVGIEEPAAAKVLRAA